MSHDIQKKGEIAVKQNQFFFIKLLGVEKQYSDQFHPPAWCIHKIDGQSLNPLHSW